MTEMRAIDVMTRDPKAVLPSDTVTHASLIMSEANIGMLPVVESYDTMQLVGVITDRDIIVRHLAEQHACDCRIADHMTQGRLDTVRTTDHIHDVMGRMRHDQIRRMPVVDDEHRLVGIIAQADVARRVGPIEPQLVEHMLEGISSP